MALDLSQPISLRPDPDKTFNLLAGSLIFTAGCVFLLIRGDILIGWLGLVTFGSAAMCFATMRITHACDLRLDPNGIAMRTLLGRWFCPWSEVQSIVVVKQSWRRVVGVKYRPRSGFESQLASITRALTGFEGMIPNIYGLDPNELAALLNQALHQARLRDDQRSIQNDSLATPSGV